MGCSRGLRARTGAVLRVGSGLSAAAVGRLLAAWQANYHAFCGRDLSDRDYLYCGADGLHLRVRLERAWLCCLVIVGVRTDGTKELVAVADGEWGSTDSSAELLCDLRCGGMRARVVMVGDGALGCGERCRTCSLPPAATATGFPQDGQRAGLPAQGRVGRVAQGAGGDPRSARPRLGPACLEVFARDDGVKWPKAVTKITDDAEELLSFFDFPTGHWQRLKTSNPIESTFSSVRLRTRVTKGPGSKAAGLRWR